MGYNIKQKPVGKYDFSKMKTNTIENKVIAKEFMQDYKEKIRVLRQRLYGLMRLRHETDWSFHGWINELYVVDQLQDVSVRACGRLLDGVV